MWTFLSSIQLDLKPHSMVYLRAILRPKSKNLALFNNCWFATTRYFAPLSMATYVLSLAIRPDAGLGRRALMSDLSQTDLTP